jgi:hypothetical protein
MEAANFSDTLVNIRQITRFHIQEGANINIHSVRI